jgi:hypothetical protein
VAITRRRSWPSAFTITGNDNDPYRLSDGTNRIDRPAFSPTLPKPHQVLVTSLTSEILKRPKQKRRSNHL